MAKTVNMHAAKTNFSKLAQEVEAGEEILIARAGKPIMKLVPLVDLPKPRTLGFAKHLVDDFDWEKWDSLDAEVAKIFRDRT